MIIARVFAVLAALLTVGAFALALLMTPTPTLGELLAMTDHDMLVVVQDGVRARAPWVWDGLVAPMLLRPCWLIPVSLAIVCGGVSLSASSRRGAPRSHRRRS